MQAAAVAQVTARHVSQVQERHQPAAVAQVLTQVQETQERQTQAAEAAEHHREQVETEDPEWSNLDIQILAQ